MTSKPRPTKIVLHQQSRMLEVAFDDGHDSGIYSWETLYELGAHHDVYWQAYLDKLKATGHERQPH